MLVSRNGNTVVYSQVGQTVEHDESTVPHGFLEPEEGYIGSVLMKKTPMSLPRQYQRSAVCFLPARAMEVSTFGTLPVAMFSTLSFATTSIPCLLQKTDEWHFLTIVLTIATLMPGT